MSLPGRARFLRPEEGFSGSLCDLHLLAVTGGQERTRSEMDELLRGAGFAQSELYEMSSLPSVIVSMKQPET